MTLQFTVHGTPVQQGSHRAFVNKKTGRAQVTDDSKKTKPWKQEVITAAREARAGHPPIADAAVEVTIAFTFLRPKGHFGSGRNANVLKPTAPSYKSTKPDIDKLTRAILDALTEAQVFRDDAQVAALNVVKGFVDDQTPGAVITVTPLLETVATGAERVDQVLGADGTEQGALL